MTWTWLVIIGGHATLVFSVRPNYAERKTRTGGPWPREVIFPFFLSCSSTKEAFSSIIFIFPAHEYTAHITLDTRHCTHSRRHSTWGEHPEIVVTYLKLTPSLSPHSHQLSDIPNLIVRFPFFWFLDFLTSIFRFAYRYFQISLLWFS